MTTLPALGIWHMKMGVGGVWGDRFHLGPTFGFGYRRSLGPLALDFSIVNPTFYHDERKFVGRSVSWARIGGYYLMQADADESFYVGGALGFTTVELQRSIDDSPWFGYGLSIDGTVGYEFARKLSPRVFAEVSISLPTYEMDSDAGGITESPRIHSYGPASSLSVGFGWGQPREVWATKAAHPESTSVVTRNLGRTAPVAGHVGYELRARTKGQSFEVRDARNEVVARCISSCTLSLFPGTYGLFPFDGQGQRKTSTHFDVERSGVYEFEESNTTKVVTGLALGIGGPLLVVLGGGLVVSAICVGCDHSQRDTSAVGSVGLLLVVSGLVVTPIGWVLFGSNLSPTVVEVKSPKPELAFSVGRDNAVFGVKGRF